MLTQLKTNFSSPHVGNSKVNADFSYLTVGNSPPLMLEVAILDHQTNNQPVIEAVPLQPYCWKKPENSSALWYSNMAGSYEEYCLVSALN